MNRQLQFLLYTTPQEDVKINVVLRDETIWLTQKAMSELFEVGVPAISKHIKNIFDNERLKQGKTATVARHCGLAPQSTTTIIEKKQHNDKASIHIFFIKHT